MSINYNALEQIVLMFSTCLDLCLLLLWPVLWKKRTVLFCICN